MLRKKSKKNKNSSRVLAVSIVFGLGFSTFITLILTPAVLALPYALKNDFKKNFKAVN